MYQNLTLIFKHFEIEHFGKDVFLVPYYLGKQYQCDVTIVYPLTKTNQHFPSEVRGVQLRPQKGMRNDKEIWREFTLLGYLVCHAKDIDILMRFHHTPFTVMMVYIYKFLNRKGKVYIKADLDADDIKEKNTGIKGLIKRLFYPGFIKRVDVCSCETLATYKALQNSNNKIFHWKNNLVLMPNGFDEESFICSGIKEKAFLEKENIMITVGRLGTQQKNTEMFLKALENVDLGDWKIYLIGPLEESFEKQLREFYFDNPQKINSVIFLGTIYDKKLLWEYYNRSKVFVLTSRWEGYPIVLTETRRFRNYILSTMVSGITDIMENLKYGIIIEQESVTSLASAIHQIVSRDLNIDVYNSDFDANSLSWKSQISKIQL